MPRFESAAVHTHPHGIRGAAEHLARLLEKPANEAVGQSLGAGAVADFTSLINCKTGRETGHGTETFTGSILDVGVGTLTWIAPCAGRPQRRPHHLTGRGPRFRPRASQPRPPRWVSSRRRRKLRSTADGSAASRSSRGRFARFASPRRSWQSEVGALVSAHLEVACSSHPTVPAGTLAAKGDPWNPHRVLGAGSDDDALRGGREPR
jgi:hypothetical protein